MKLAKIFFFLTLLTATTSAQAASPWSVGALAGLDIASTKITWRNQDLAAVNGFTGGASAIYKYSDSVSAQLEALYVQKGYLDRAASTTYSYNYLALPMLTHLAVPAVHHAYLLVGPEVDIRLSSSSQSGAASTDVVGIPSLDASLDFGVGVEGMIAQQYSAFAEIRTSFGLTNLQPTLTASQKNRTWYFLVGSRFSL